LNTALHLTAIPLRFVCAAQLGRSMNKEGIKKLESQVDSLLTLFMRAYSQYLFQRPMMVNTDIISRMGKEGKRRGFEHLRNQLYWNLVQEIVKICDDSDERTPCIKKITMKLKDKNTLKILEDGYSNQGYPRVEGEDYATWEKLQKEYQDDWRKKFKKTYDRMIKNAEELLSSDILSGYKTVRDKVLAHNELRLVDSNYELFDISVLNLKFGQERIILDRAKEIIDDLNSLVRGASFSWDSFIDPETRAVCTFWSIKSIERAN